MIISYSKILGLPIAEIKDQTRLGKVSDVIIGIDDLSVAGLAVQPDFYIFYKPKVISGLDIITLLKDGVLVKDEESLLQIDDEIKIKRLVGLKSYGIKQKVKTPDGNLVGIAEDYMIDSHTLAITKICVRKMLSERMIPVSKIDSFDGQTFIVKGNYERQKVSALSEEIAVS